MRPRLSLLPLLLLAATPLVAQTPEAEASPSPIQTRVALWRCISEGGNYAVAVNNIVSVSIHSYQVDKVAKVSEVNVDTTGTALVRFYYIEPLEPQTPSGVGQSTIDRLRGLAEEAVDRTGQGGLLNSVIKSYPTSTHARTIEYRINSRDELQRIFNSADTAFRARRAMTVRVGKPEE